MLSFELERLGFNICSVPSATSDLPLLQNSLECNRSLVASDMLLYETAGTIKFIIIIML